VLSLRLSFGLCASQLDQNARQLAHVWLLAPHTANDDAPVLLLVH
jgi:hypothetical protein